MASKLVIVATLFAPSLAWAQEAVPEAPPEPAPVEPTPPEPAPAPAPAPAPVVTVVAAPPPPAVKKKPKDEEYDPAKAYEYSLGFEVGYAQTADTDQLYGNGFGKTLVLGYEHYEVRVLENYDVEDQSDMFDAAGAEAHLGITSFGYRWHLPQGAFALRPLVGLAWMRRQSLRSDPDDIFEELTVRSQHGLGVMVGGGAAIRLGHIALSVDLRFYPTYWQGIDGTRAVVRDDAVVLEPVTESPGGMPRTITFALTIGG